MTDAVDTVLHDWAIPRMSVPHILVSTFEGSEDNVKAFLRNRFKTEATCKDYFEVKGKIRGVHVLESLL